MRYYDILNALKWQKSRDLTTMIAGKNVEQQEFSFPAAGNANLEVTLKAV